METIKYVEILSDELTSNSIIVKLHKNMGYYLFNLDLQYIKEKLNDLHINDIHNIEEKATEILTALVSKKIDGMLTEKDYRYLNYEMFYIDKYIRSTSTNKTVCKEQNYLNYIGNAIDKGFITEQDIKRYEMQVRARYDVHKNMRPEKLARRIKGETYIRTKSRMTYIKNLKMIEHITSIEDFIVNNIKKYNSTEKYIQK